MAKTSGHGNAPWSREETILALDLLNKLGGHVPDKTNAAVISLSEYLRSMPIHPPEKQKNSFRSPDGVAFKLQNLRAVATGKGLTNVSQVDKAVWAELGGKSGEVAQLAAEIRANTKALLALDEADDRGVDDYGEEFAEGATATALHKRRERSRKLRKKLIAKCIKNNQLFCHACGEAGPFLGHDYTQSIFEAHHIRPLAGGPTATTVTDLALLCANCHRLIHRVMSKQKKWIDVDAFKVLLDAAHKGLQKAA